MGKSGTAPRDVEAKKAGLEHDDDLKLHNAFVPHAQIANLVSTEVEEFVCRQIDSEDTERQLIGRFLAKWLGTERLLLYMVKRWHVEGYIIPGEHEIGWRLGAANWVHLWEQSTTEKEKKALIEIASDLRDARVEDILIGCLEDTRFSGSCAQSLAFMGSQRACPAIRNLLAKERELDTGKNWKLANCLFASSNSRRTTPNSLVHAKRRRFPSFGLDSI